MNFRILFAILMLLLPVAVLAESESKPKPDAVTQAQPISGKVLEVMHSSSYTYLLLDIEGFKDWVAIPEMYVEVGEEVELIAGAEMRNFKSRALERSFERIIFSAGPTEKYNEKRKANAHKGVDMSESALGIKKAAGKFVEGLKVEKAKGDNAYTIAELFVKRNELQDKVVSVSGQVLKVSTGIMERNWVHIVDSSGEKGDNKLVVTTKAAPNAGDVVTVTGVFHNNVDFGGGYQYAVIIENAEIK